MSQTVKCPQCKSSVSISEQHAGKRVACPKCTKEFLAPGFVAAVNDDDDWLSLDDDEPTGKPLSTAPLPTPKQSTTPKKTSPPKKPASTKKSSKGKPTKPDALPQPSAAPESDPFQLSEPIKRPAPTNVGSPALSGADQAALDEFGGLDEFTSGVEPLPSSSSKTPASSPPADDPFGELPDVPPAPSVPRKKRPDNVAAPQPTAAQPVEFETDFRVKCNVCGSLLYAKASQSGKQIKCSDCYSLMTVPPPPKKKQKPAKVDISKAKVMPLEESTVAERKDPYLKSAEDLLRDAESTAEESEPPNYDDPDIKEWAMNVFGIFLDLGVILHWLILSTLFAIPAYFAISWEHPILRIGVMAGAIMLSALMVACGFAIMISVSNQEDRVEEWPEADPIGWMDQLFVALAAAALAAAPAYMLGYVTAGAGMLTVFFTMASIYALFPFFLLSMLDMGSVFTPFSPEVARSTTRCQESWGGFYFSAGLLFAALFVFFFAISQAENLAGVVAIGIFAAIAVAFMYFSMLGRLAYAIGQEVNEPRGKKSEQE